MHRDILLLLVVQYLELYRAAGQEGMRRDMLVLELQLPVLDLEMPLAAGM